MAARRHDAEEPQVPRVPDGAPDPAAGTGEPHGGTPSDEPDAEPDDAVARGERGDEANASGDGTGADGPTDGTDPATGEGGRRDGAERSHEPAGVDDAARTPEVGARERPGEPGSGGGASEPEATPAHPTDPTDPGDRAGDPDAGGAGTGPEPVTDEDAAWRELVARLEAMGPPADDADVRRPARRVLRRAERESDADAGPGADAGGEPGGRADAEPVGPRAWAPDAELEERENHFEPPDPGPVLGGDPLVTMAWVAAVGAPLLLVATVVLWQDAPAIVLRAAGVVFVIAVGILVWRMPHQRDDDAGPGAVV